MITQDLPNMCYYLSFTDRNVEPLNELVIWRFSLVKVKVVRGVGVKETESVVGMRETELLTPTKGVTRDAGVIKLYRRHSKPPVRIWLQRMNVRAVSEMLGSCPRNVVYVTEMVRRWLCVKALIRTQTRGPSWCFYEA